MQVVGAVKKPNCTVFIVRGYPGDVNWCTGEIKRKSYLSIRTSMGKIFLAQASNEEALDRVSFEAGHNVDVLYRRIELPLAWPLEEGQKICDDDALGESGISNCWLVEEVQTVSLGRIRGIPPGATARQYRLVLRTGPDMQEVFLVPGIGIVRYRYRHHGTLFESDLSLVEFQKPAGSIMLSWAPLNAWIDTVENSLDGLKVVFEAQESHVEVGGAASEGAAEVLPDSRKIYIFGQRKVE